MSDKCQRCGEAINDMVEALRKADAVLRQMEDAELSSRRRRLDILTVIQPLIAVTSAALAKVEIRPQERRPQAGGD